MNNLNNIIDNSTMVLYNNNDKHNKNDGRAWWPHVSISNNNKKMGTATASVSLLTACTCSEKMPCYKDCYARRMEHFRPSIYNAYLNNYIVYKKDPALFFNSVKAAMLQSLYFRFFVSGDIPDIEFLRQAITTAEQVPHCKVLLFSKKYTIVNKALAERGGVLPKNFTIILSEWAGLNMSNPYKLPVAKVVENYEISAKNAYICTNNCAACQAAGRGCFYAANGSTVVFKKH